MGAISPWIKQLKSDLHLFLRLIMCGVVRPLSHYTLSVWCLDTGMSLPSSLLFIHKIVVIEFLFAICDSWYVNRWDSVM